MGDYFTNLKKNILSLEIEQRALKTLEEFKHASTSGLSEHEGVKILGNVGDYWKDTFRPALILLSCEAVGGKTDQVDNFSLIINLLSAGLGIHDDIIDKSQNKHLRPTILGLYGLDKAVLAGDFLIVKALTRVQSLLREGYALDKIEKIIGEIENFFVEVWEGELIEISCRKKIETDLEVYLKCLWMSTADTEACGKIGAILGDAKKAETEALSDFGRRLGLIYRLAGEISDVLGVEGNLLERLENESVPLPVLYAAKTSNEAHKKISTIFRNSPITLAGALMVLQQTLKTKAIDYTNELIKYHAKKALLDLEALKPTEARKILGEFVTQATETVDSLMS